MLVLKSILIVIIVFTSAALESTSFNNETVVSKDLTDVKKHDFSKENNSNNIAPSSVISDQSIAKRNFSHVGRERIPLPVFSEGQSSRIKMDDIKSKINGSLPDSLNTKPLSAAVPLHSSENLKGNSSVLPRKEAPLGTVISKNNSKADKLESKLVDNTLTNTSVTLNVSSSNQDLKSTPNNFENPKNITAANVNATTTKKPIPKKPLITVGTAEAFPTSKFLPNSNDVLPSSSTMVKAEPVTNGSSIIKNFESSSPIISSMENPIDDVVETNPQFYQDHVNYSEGQPGYIIPVVITLFAVPLLGFIGYQAIHRGKEAWRNRHYRRMDFLIDGMYND